MKVTDEKEAKAIQLPGRTIKVLADPEGIGSKHITFVLALIPEGESLPWHVHEGAEEIIYVLQGTGSAHSDTETKPIHPGTVLYMEADSSHRIVNEGKGEVKLLCAFSPPVKIGPPK
jgi:quercetin dioxygenase-like cupin family protein